MRMWIFYDLHVSNNPPNPPKKHNHFSDKIVVGVWGRMYMSVRPSVHLSAIIEQESLFLN